MKSSEEMTAYFQSMPKKEKVNPYWEFDWATKKIRAKSKSVFGKNMYLESLDPSKLLLCTIRNYFQMVYESFGTEAQVLCVTKEDGRKLDNLGIPSIPSIWTLQDYMVRIFVLPQMNTPSNSIVSDSFWQQYIIGSAIIPIARVHSHHILDAYQSGTDYSTLNSNTLEIVLGHIRENPFQAAVWLDEHGKETKSFVFRSTVAKEACSVLEPITCHYGNKQLVTKSE